MHNLSLILSVVLALQVSANTSGARLLRRQTTPLPTSVCSSDCTPVQSALQTCIQDQIQQSQTQAASGNTTITTPPNCVCTTPVSSSLKACWNCYASKTGDVTGAQQALAAIGRVCSDPTIADGITVSAGPSGATTITGASPTDSAAAGSTGTSKSGAITRSVQNVQVTLGMLLIAFTMILT